MRLTKKTFPNQLKPLLQATAFSKALKIFFRHVQFAWGQAQQKPSNIRELFSIKRIHQLLLSKKVVAVLYRSSCGNGHYIPSLCIKDYLEQKGHKAVLVDSSGYECKAADKQLSLLAADYKDLTLLRHRIKRIEPDLIISTVAHHASSWNQIAYDLNTPMLVLYTDYEIYSGVAFGHKLPRYPHLYDAPSLIQYGIPHEYEDANQELMKKKLTIEELKSLIKPVGFPIRSSFKRETDQTTIDKLRGKLGIQQDERVILMLGESKEDKTHIKQLITQLLINQTSFPLYLVAICGKKKTSQDQIKTFIEALPSHDTIRVKIEGALNEKTMADYMKVASRVSEKPGFMITKTGRSITAEATEMGVYVLSLNSKPEEIVNEFYLEKAGLGELIHDDQFIDQIEEILNWTGDRQTIYRSLLSWQKNLDRLVKVN